MNTPRDAFYAFLHGKIGRREFVTRALMLGASMSSITALLAACGGGDSDDDEDTTPEASGAGAAPTATSEDTGTEATEPAAEPTEEESEATAEDSGTSEASEPANMAEEQRLIIANSQAIVSLDPLKSSDYYSMYVYGLIQDSVASLDQDLNIQPHLAESWEVSEDGLTYTYKFREGVMSHQGTELTADDVVFTLDRIFSEEFADNPVVGRIEMIEDYQKIDDYTVEITLEFAFAPFELAWGIQFILPQAAVEEIGNEDFGTNPVGFGPFQFVEWVPNDHVTIERFEDYWLATPNLARIDVRPIPENSVAVANLLSQDVDVITDVVGPTLEQLQSADGVTVLSQPGLSYTFAGFRMMDAPFTDQRFREAVYMATDYDGLIGAIFPPELGERAYNTVPPGLWPRDEEFMAELESIALPQDQARAEELFQELIDEGLMSEDYTVTIAATPGGGSSLRIAEAMVTNLREVGVNSEVVQVEWATYLNELLVGEENLIYMLGTTPDYPDPDDNVRWLFGDVGSHAKFLNLPEFEQYPEWLDQLETAMKSQDQEERAQIYRDIVRTMMELRVHIPLYHQNTVMATRDYVKDLNLSKIIEWRLVESDANVYIEG